MRDGAALSRPPRGRASVQAHAGFLGAWLHAGFNTKVLARLKELDERSPQPLRLWVAGEPGRPAGRRCAACGAAVWAG